ncbi:MAG: hypothetical protein HYY00_01930 [Chloroflexi bacterium]|nr:hypothetical protein [Chloroflexota bacterium]
MTNTLHRYGNPESLRDDYIVFAIPARGINDQGCVEKLRTFLRSALKYNPVNVGEGAKGGIFRPSKSLNLISTYLRPRKHGVAPQEVAEGVDGPGTVAAVFDNKESMERFLEEVKSLDLGISVNVSALVDDTREACRLVGICPHSVEYSLGFRGRTERLASRRVLELSTMCGHGMVSFRLAQKMIDQIKEGRQTPEKASTFMAKFCTCGVFNVSRARRLMEEARVSD